jgi:short-subunit dehydrogenase
MNESITSTERRVALVTGAAGGMGSSFARQLASAKYDLLLTDKDRELLEAISAEIAKDYAVQPSTMVADLGDAGDLARLVDRVATMEPLDMLVNNAGFATRGAFWQRDLSKEIAMVHVHVDACVSLTRAALPAMVATGRGSIINVSSLAAFVPMGGGDTYAATKAFIVVLSEFLQNELMGTGVQVLALCPGPTHTGFHDTPEWEGFERSDIPAFLWSHPDDVVRSALDAVRQKKVICIPGFTNRVIREVGTNRIFRWLWRKLVAGRPVDGATSRSNE